MPVWHQEWDPWLQVMMFTLDVRTQCQMQRMGPDLFSAFDFAFLSKLHLVNSTWSIAKTVTGMQTHTQTLRVNTSFKISLVFFKKSIFSKMMQFHAQVEASRSRKKTGSTGNIWRHPLWNILPWPHSKRNIFHWPYLNQKHHCVLIVHDILLQHHPWYRQLVEGVWRVRTPDTGEDEQDDVRDWRRLPASPGRTATGRRRRGTTLFFLFFFKIFGGHMSFLWATDTPVLDFWWRLPWVSKPGWSHLRAFLPARYSSSPLVRHLPTSWQPALRPRYHALCG